MFDARRRDHLLGQFSTAGASSWWDTEAGGGRSMVPSKVAPCRDRGLPHWLGKDCGITIYDISAPPATGAPGPEIERAAAGESRQGFSSCHTTPSRPVPFGRPLPGIPDAMV